ncbi:hypothetical protein Pint_12776 [Pistacia integerrima]|uniref:Uncharacterized protein n=1 Tax=Pistacia integerrima TaxID=434235 RepID=A0ACC0YA63_9ROSI|nr:hypothetical protein Pint_12776 [Pistacia integerrima]
MGIKMWRNSGGAVCETIHLGRSYSQHKYKEDSHSRWRSIWKKIKGEKKKVFHYPVTLQAYYDPDEYSQNFDQGTGWAEPDNLHRSFSARYANPSRASFNNFNFLD